MLGGASLLMVVPKPMLPEIPSRAPSTYLVPRAEEQTTKYQVDRDDKEGVGEKAVTIEITMEITTRMVGQGNLSSQHVLS